MPKYRQLHVKIIDSFDFNEMPDDFTRLTWTLLLLIVDGDGRGIDNMAWVRSKMYPLRNDVEIDGLTAAFDFYEQRKMIGRYEANGKKYFFIINWKEYQTGTDREARSNFPPPPEISASTQEPLVSNSGVSQEEVHVPASASASASVNDSVNERENVFRVYEQEIGLLTPSISNKIGVELDTAPVGWITDAIHEAAANNARSWAYVSAILKRWRKEGRGDKRPPTKQDEPIFAEEY